jgi:serine protease Do
MSVEEAESSGLMSCITRTFSPALVLAALAAGVLTATGDSPAEERLDLRNGAAIEAGVVKETDEKVFVDLGFDVLGIPARAVLERTDLAEAQSPAPETLDEASGPEAGKAETWQAISARALADRRKRLPTEVLERAKKGVVIVSTPSGFGSGFVIDRRGRVVTNQHVVLDEKYVDVTLIRREGGEIQRDKIKSVELLALSPLLDIALLQLPEAELERLNLEPLPLGAPDSLTEGETVFAIGNPGMGREILDFTLSQGIASSVDRNFSDVLFVQTTAAVNPGNSGGPLVNDYGEVIGLVSLKAIFQEGIAFALPVEYIRFFLRNQKAFAYGKTNPNTGYRYMTPD